MGHILNSYLFPIATNPTIPCLANGSPLPMSVVGLTIFLVSGEWSYHFPT